MPTFESRSVYMVTAATYQKVAYFNTSNRLKFLHDTLLALTKEYGWALQSWAVFANHYHFIATSPNNPENLSALLSQLHVTTARKINQDDNTTNRQVWWQFWDSHITFQYSYLARLNYVNQNPVKHGLVSIAADYPWCSASWFERTTSPPFRKTVASFKIDKLKIQDDF